MHAAALGWCGHSCRNPKPPRPGNLSLSVRPVCLVGESSCVADEIASVRRVHAANSPALAAGRWIDAFLPHTDDGAADWLLANVSAAHVGCLGVPKHFGEDH